MPTTTRSLLESREVAAFLRVSPATLRTWHARGAGPPAIKIGKFLRWRQEDLEAWLEQKAASP